MDGQTDGRPLLVHLGAFDSDELKMKIIECIYSREIDQNKKKMEQATILAQDKLLLLPNIITIPQGV